MSAVMKGRVPQGVGVLVWQLSKYAGLAGLIAKAKAAGVDWIWLKGADGGSIWYNQMTPAIVAQLHQAGFGIIGWQYVYGGPGNGAASWSTVEGEIAAANYILSCGCDAYCFDNEVEFAGKPAQAIAEWQGIRAKYPNASLGYNPFPFPSGAASQPFFEFNSGVDWCSPQLYVGQDGLGTPAEALPRCLADYAKWSPIWAARAGGKPAVPMIIDWQAASWPNAVQPDSFILQAAQVSWGKVGGITYWDLDSLTSGEATALAQASAWWHQQEGATQMAWTKQADGSGVDAQGHRAGQGDYDKIVAAGLTAVDGLASETYWSGTDSVLPLANDDTITCHVVYPTGGGAPQYEIGMVTGGGHALAAFMQKAADAQAAAIAAQQKAQQLQGQLTALQNSAAIDQGALQQIQTLAANALAGK